MFVTVDSSVTKRSTEIESSEKGLEFFPWRVLRGLPESHRFIRETPRGRISAGNSFPWDGKPASSKSKPPRISEPGPLVEGIHRYAPAHAQPG